MPQSDEADVLTKIPPDNRIPATIITGFLGSGKVGSFAFGSVTVAGCGNEYLSTLKFLKFVYVADKVATFFLVSAFWVLPDADLVN